MQQQRNAPEGARWVQVGGHRGTVPRWTLVDEADLVWVSQIKWYYHKNGYAYRAFRLRGGTQRSLFLHREILGLEHGDPLQGDHINRDRLDNRRANLRVVSLAENVQNQGSRAGTSVHRGVFWRARDKVWIAHAMVAHKKMHLGTFRTEAEAAECASRFRAQHMPFATDGLEHHP